MTAFWHPFAAMHSVRDGAVTITRGEDVWVYDDRGRRFLDATASLWYSNVGHGRGEIVDAVANQMYELEAYSTFTDFTNAPAERLATEIAERVPVDDAKVFFTSGGGDSVETAAKLAREYFVAVGEPDRTVLLHREHSYHGTHGFGTSLAGIPGNRLGAPFTPDVVQTAWDDAAALEKTIVDVGPERVAAFFCEPVIGAGGVLPPPPGYVEAAADVCRRHGVLFVADEVICGFGRLGTWLGIDRFGVRPDIATFAKGITSGYQPLGGMIASGRVAAPFWDEPGRIFKHGQTYAGHPAACAAGSATIALMERDGLLDRALQLEPVLLAGLASLEDHPLVGHARGGVGVLGALAVDPERLAATPDLPVRIAKATREHGVLIRATATALVCSPPLTFTRDHVDLLVEGTRNSLDDVLKSL
ncbi:aminotransferase family protein [Pseudonocardia phyllosphaerae]|uniref:aminotransferase family protein n=1 Tax=Pseudonocardia phyllosphaerae TaxID=3390502 RepID=UPI00397C18D3